MRLIVGWGIDKNDSFAGNKKIAVKKALLCIPKQTLK
jgi:hypothetical protein